MPHKTRQSDLKLQNRRRNHFFTKIWRRNKFNGMDSQFLFSLQYMKSFFELSRRTVAMRKLKVFHVFFVDIFWLQRCRFGTVGRRLLNIAASEKFASNFHTFYVQLILYVGLVYALWVSLGIARVELLVSARERDRIMDEK